MKKSFRRVCAMILIVVCSLTMAGCGKKDHKDKKKDDGTTEMTTEATSEATTEEPQPEVDEEGFTIVNQVIKTTDYVNVRKGPSTDAEKVMQLAIDAEVNRIGYNDEWSKVNIDGQTLYIFSEYVTVVSDANAGGSVTTQGPVQTAGKIICIDAGHQAQPNTGEEPIGPGAEEKKTKVSAGTTGVSTGKNEYELNLEIALKLQTELMSRGYEVVMIRTTNDVDISNAARAELANQAHADAFIRIHANGSTDSNDKGCLTICQTASNPYNSNLYSSSKNLASAVLNGLTEATGAVSEGVWETDSMSGINWCEVPVTIVEVGYLTNAEEEQLLVSEDYQNQIAEGIANGVDSYIASLSAGE